MQRCICGNIGAHGTMGSPQLNAIQWRYLGLELQAGSPQWWELIETTRMDLSNPGHMCNLVYALTPAVGPDTFIHGVCQTTAENMIALAQESLRLQYLDWWAMAHQDATGTVPFPVEATGSYDCATAEWMTQVAQQARGTGIGGHDAWSMGMLEFSYLYNSSARAQMGMLGTAKVAGVQAAAGFCWLPSVWPDSVVQSAQVAYQPPGADQAGMTRYVPPPMPSGCGHENPGYGETIGDRPPPRVREGRIRPGGLRVGLQHTASDRRWNPGRSRTHVACDE